MAVETPQLDGPYGARGVGEHPMISVAPAIGNAIQHATGAELMHMPIRAEDVWRAMRDKEPIDNWITETPYRFLPVRPAGSTPAGRRARSLAPAGGAAAGRTCRSAAAGADGLTAGRQPVPPDLGLELRPDAHQQVLATEARRPAGRPRAARRPCDAPATTPSGWPVMLNVEVYGDHSRTRCPPSRTSPSALK